MNRDTLHRMFAKVQLTKLQPKLNEHHSCRFTEKFTGKRVITPDSEEGGVITPDFTTPVKGLK